MKLETSESLDLLNFGYERCLRNASHGSEISATSLIVAIYLLGVSLAIAAHLYFTAVFLRRLVSGTQESMRTEK